LPYASTSSLRAEARSGVVVATLLVEGCTDGAKAEVVEHRRALYSKRNDRKEKEASLEQRRRRRSRFQNNSELACSKDCAMTYHQQEERKASWYQYKCKERLEETGAGQRLLQEFVRSGGS